MRRIDPRRRNQSGQAAVEWVLTLPVIVVIVMVLYQALMFERDVFNKMNLARFEAFKRAHKDQNVEGMKDYSIFEVKTQGRTLGELTGFSVPGQSIAKDRRYGPKVYYFPCGTKRFFPGGDTAETVLDVAQVAMVVLDHVQETSSAIKSVANAAGQIGNAANQLPCEQASEFTDILNEGLNKLNVF